MEGSQVGIHGRERERERDIPPPLRTLCHKGWSMLPCNHLILKRSILSGFSRGEEKGNAI
jgi:hypothetical protein